MLAPRRKRTLWTPVSAMALVATAILGAGMYSADSFRGHAQAAPEGIGAGPTPEPGTAPGPNSTSPTAPNPGQATASSHVGARGPKVSTLDLANGSWVPGNVPGVRGGLPSLEAYDGSNARVFVTEFSYGIVGELSTATNTLVGAIPASDPDTIAYDGATGNVFIGLQLADAVEVANASTGVVLGTTSLGAEPLAMAVDAASGAVFVSTVSPGNNTGNLTELNGTNGAVRVTVPVVPFPSGVAYDGTNGRLYVTSGTSGNVSEVSAATGKVVATGTLPFTPGPSLYVPATNRLYIANASGSNLSVVAPVGLHVRASVDLPSTGTFLAADPNGSAVYVGDLDHVTVVGTATSAVLAEYPQIRSPDGLAYDSAHGALFVSDEPWNNVSVVNASTGAAVASVALGASPYNLAYDPVTGDLYVADLESSGLIVVNATSERVVGRLAVGSAVYGIAYDPRTHDLYADDYDGDNVSVLDPATGAILAYIGVGTNPWGIAYDAADHDLYVTNPSSDNISVINPRTDAVVASLGAGVGTGAVAYDPVSELVAVAEYNSGNVTLFNGTTNALVGSVGAGVEPYTLAIDPKTGDMFVGNEGSSNVTVLSANGTTLVAGIPVGSEPFGSAFDPVDGDVYVATFGGDAVSVINGATLGLGATYGVGVGPVAAAADPRTGTVFVSDYDSSSLSILSPRASFPHYPVTFHETGLPIGTVWNVALDGGLPVGSNTTKVVFQAENGTYDYVVGAIPGYRTAYEGVASVNGGTVVHPHFAVAEYRWVFHEIGLPTGTNWTVTIGATTYSGNGTKIVIYVANGTYAYSVAATGYTPTPGGGSTTITGAGTSQAIRFS